MILDSKRRCMKKGCDGEMENEVKISQAMAAAMHNIIQKPKRLTRGPKMTDGSYWVLQTTLAK